MTAMSTPCVNICIVDPASGLCLGCGRTLGEIAAWSGLNEGERWAIMATLDERLARLDAAGPDAGAGDDGDRGAGDRGAGRRDGGRP
jgi:uncharacterized protein